MPSSCSVSSLLTFFLHFLRHRWRAWKRKRWKKRQCVTLAAFFTLTFHFSFPSLFFLSVWQVGGRKVVWAAQLSMTSSSGSSSCYLSSSRQSWNDAAVCKCEFPSASTHWWLFVCVRERGRKKAVRVGLFDWAIIFSTKLSDTKKKKVTKDVKRTFLLKPAPGRQPDSSLALYSCAQSKTHMMAALQQTFFFFLLELY